ncbi:cytochrome P450 family protein [Mycobacterium kansasii 824]|nr:cytochrome P450 family protein [Mycobacterium kansasii 824]
MSDYDSIDFFTDPSLVPDPYPYFDYLRSRNPVLRLPHHGVVAVTGYEEAAAVYKDTDSFSNCVALGGPFPPLPFEPAGDDINAQIDQHREKFPMYEHMVTMDPPDHTRARSLLSRLLTPSRLKQNEEFMWRLADRQLDEFLGNGRCEFISEYSKPFATLVIADLLGVPEDDHKEFRVMLGAERPGSRVGGLDHESVGTNPLQWLDEKFSSYIEDRRREPRDDVLTALATAKYPDGSTPEVIDVVRSATFLFAAGQETTAKLLSAALQVLVERPDIQERLREDRSLIPSFIEESLRLESPVKSDSRLARRSTTVAGVDIPAGTVVVVLPGPSTATRAGSTIRTSFAWTERTFANTWPLPEGSTPAPAHRLPASRAVFRSSASSTGWPTSPSTRPDTGRQAIAAIAMNRPISCAASPNYT